MVDGHSVAVQSPARYKPGHCVDCCGLNLSRPGVTEKVARASFNTPLFSSFACLTAGKKLSNSCNAEDSISSLSIFNSAHDALMTSSR